MDEQDGDKLFLKAAGRVVRCFLDVKKSFFDFCFLVTGMDKGKIVNKEDARVVLDWLVETIGTCQLPKTLNYTLLLFTLSA